MEQWRPVADWPEYSISDLGRVRSEARVIMRCNGYRYSVAERILRPHQHGLTESSSTVAFSRPGEPQCRCYVTTLMHDNWKETQ